MVDEAHDCSAWGLEPEPYPNLDPASPHDHHRGGEPFEAAALAVATRIQPTATSEARRAAVIDYVQRVVRCTVGCEVFPFGSVPLKTYLPDGDIDLTGFGPSISDENLAKQVQSVLESEEMRDDAEFEVKDVQYINAEVKLVKCIVQNIIIDISFNQFGGLCTLCFLEQVDQKFGKDHLFKRSIILIKAWCYYESRILGAHHGLISTYALEILVLHVFHVFHESLDSPLVVLYRFLDYYSKFDWDNKGISLYGPVSLSSLPELVTDPLDSDDDAFLKREEFLKECAQMFTVPPRNTEQNTRAFARKFFNIVDPLKQSNNLGRSVSKGNFIRIRSAFHFGARKLGKILQFPANSTLDEVKQFFRNTLLRHCTRVRPDVHETTLGFDAERAENGCLPLYSNSFGDLSDQFNSISISDSSIHGSLKQKEWNSMSDHKEMKSFTGGGLASNDTNTVSTNSAGVMSTSDFCESAPPSTTGAYSLPSGKGHSKPHLLNESENGEKVGINYDANLSRHGMSTIEEVDGDGDAINGNLSDLTGDYRTHLNNLLYAQGLHQDYPTHQYYPTSPVYYQMLAPPPAQYQNKRSSNGHSRKNGYGYAGTNGIGPGPCPPGYFVLRPYSQMDDPRGTRGTGTYFPDPTLSKDRSPTGRGGRGKGHFLPPYHQRSHHYGRADMSSDFTHSVELRRAPPPLPMYIPGANDLGMPSPLRIPIPSPSSAAEREMINDNGFVQLQDRKLEFGTLRALPVEVTSQSQEHAITDSQPSAHKSTMSPAQNPASNNQPSSPASTMSPAKNPASNNQPSAPAITMSPTQNRGMGSNRMRNTQPYRLKDKGDFPPLSS